MKRTRLIPYIVALSVFSFCVQAAPVLGQAAAPKKSSLDTPEEQEAPARPARPPVVEVEEPKAAPAKNNSAGKPEGDDTREGQEKPERVCDTLYINQNPIPVALLPTPLRLPVAAQDKFKQFKFKRLTSSEKGYTIHSAEGGTIGGVRYYEERMWQKAASAMQLTPKRLAEPGAVLDLSAPEALSRAEQAERVLVVALAEHDSAVQANQRQGVQWDAMFRQPLIQALLNIRLGRADVLLAEGQLEPALRLSDSLLAEFNNAPGAVEALRHRFERIFLTQAEQAVAAVQQVSSQDEQAAGYAEARRLLNEFARRYPRGSGAAEKFRARLAGEAKSLLQQAEALPPEKAREAQALVARAGIIWPDLPKLDALRQHLDDRYRTLHVAYTSLPQNFAPMLARSPVERHAVSLLFEGLIRWWDGKSGPGDETGEGGHYEPQLAHGRPVSLSRGRQFYLEDAHWSDSTPADPHVLTLADVQQSVKLYVDKSLPGHLPAWANLVRADVQPLANDHFTACIWLQRDHWQPLSMMDFKVMPANAFPHGTLEELSAFNKAPVGTGPFVLGPAADADQVRFVANPRYRQPGKPHINEIIFHRLTATQAKEQFLQGKLNLVFDVHPDHVAEIRQQRRTVRTVTSPSVWFLAPRYSSENKPSPLDNADLRLAIAHTIQRETILNQYFRAGSTTDHAALTGPYPRKSWAYNPKEMSFSPALAAVHIEEARRKLKRIPNLKLVFPDEDPTSATAQACTEIRKQLAADPLNLDITLVPVSPEKFMAHIDAGDFDLAYWRHDFKDQCYWLWPLLDPLGIGPGGPNFMRYRPDTAGLAELFRQLNTHKRFPEIQKLTRDIHEHVFKNAIVIPLWQLDTYVAVDEALKNVRLDPWVLYGNVADWDLPLRSK